MLFRHHQVKKLDQISAVSNICIQITNPIQIAVGVVVPKNIPLKEAHINLNRQDTEPTLGSHPYAKDDTAELLGIEKAP